MNINQVKQHNLKFFSVFFYLILLFSTNKIIHNYSYSYKKEIELKCTYFDNFKIGKDLKKIIKNDYAFCVDNKSAVFLY
ncbi:MAG TPA: hypothetical protein PK332_11645, partial [Chitinophagales bacterium]|nr:hypothetical protein [Chitinophagales bacterium]